MPSPPKQPARPSLVISVVSYNTRADLAACLESVYGSGIGKPFDVVVVDNGSTDGSPEMVREKFPQATLIQASENLGYGRANNKALLGRPADTYVILNSDIVLPPGSVEILLAKLESSPCAGMVMGALVNPDGAYQTTWAAGELSVASVLWEQIFLSRLFPKSRIFGAYFRTDWDHASFSELAQACAAYIAVRADLYNKLMGFDPAYFMYCEDTDLSRRIRDAGQKIIYVPDARAVHGHGKSSQGALRPQMILEHNRSRCLYFQKFAGRRAARQARSIMVAGACLRVLLWGFLSIFRAGARERARVYLDIARQTAKIPVP